MQLRTFSRSSVQALAGTAGNTYLNFFWLGLFFSSGSAIVLSMFHNSHSIFHGDRTGLPHTFCRVPSGGGESDKHWLCAVQTLFFFQIWYIILLIAQWQVLFLVPSHYHMNFLKLFWQFKQEPHSQCFSAISWGLLLLSLRRSDCSKKSLTDLELCICLLQRDIHIYDLRVCCTGGSQCRLVAHPVFW